MKVAFTGASGFIAKAIREKLSANEVEFFALKRNASFQEWKQIIQKADVIINLAGAPVIQRWTKKNRTEIYDSRILTTRKLVNILNELEIIETEKLFISASAIGLYPNSGDQLNT
ncbi:MAG: NAD-dependent epimerase/dehydratase family protein, partial [Prolixibacteraceae bacterium]|nr:NAD-dependent epimerase/dehydratase family protein [Prolixibacteraceae bacterium]